MNSKCILIYNFVIFCHITCTFCAVRKPDSKLSALNLKGILRNPHLEKAWKRSLDTASADYDDYFYQNLDEPEPDCPEGQYWHVRGFGCVPFDCPGGNQFRDKHTGECILRRYGITDETRDRPSRLNSRMKTQTKFRLPFGLTLKG